MDSFGTKMPHAKTKMAVSTFSRQTIVSRKIAAKLSSIRPARHTSFASFRRYFPKNFKLPLPISARFWFTSGFKPAIPSFRRVWDKQSRQCSTLCRWRLFLFSPGRKFWEDRNVAIGIVMRWILSHSRRIL